MVFKCIESKTQQVLFGLVKIMPRFYRRVENINGSVTFGFISYHLIESLSLFALFCKKKLKAYSVSYFVNTQLISLQIHVVLDIDKT